MKVYGRDIKSQDDDSKLLKSLQDKNIFQDYRVANTRNTVGYFLLFFELKFLLRIVSKSHSLLSLVKSR